MESRASGRLTPSFAKFAAPLAGFFINCHKKLQYEAVKLP
jgi:hypothetical protein